MNDYLKIFGNLNFLYFVLSAVVAKIYLHPQFKGADFSYGICFSPNPYSFQVIVDQSCQKVVYVGSISKAFFNTFFYCRGFNFFKKMIVSF